MSFSVLWAHLSSTFSLEGYYSACSLFSHSNFYEIWPCCFSLGHFYMKLLTLNFTNEAELRKSFLTSQRSIHMLFPCRVLHCVGPSSRSPLLCSRSFLSLILVLPILLILILPQQFFLFVGPWPGWGPWWVSFGSSSSWPALAPPGLLTVSPCTLSALESRKLSQIQLLFPSWPLVLSNEYLLAVLGSPVFRSVRRPVASSSFHIDTETMQSS